MDQAPPARRPSPVPIDRLLVPLHRFTRHGLAGAFLLLAMTVAMIWANSAYRSTYQALLDTIFTVGLGQFELSKPLLLWINDGLMGVFFFLVGLEIKRELKAGELSSFRKAILPVIAAIGGMVVPAAVYLAVGNWHGPGQAGWGIPMATDIAFSLGVMSLLGRRVPLGLKVLLTALAIADDIGAILVIAIFYTPSISTASLLIGGLLLGLSIVANLTGVRNPIVYFLIGMLVWLAFLKSGVHATVAAVLMALTIPGRTRVDGAVFRDQMDRLLEELGPGDVRRGRKLLATHTQETYERMAVLLHDATAPLQRIEHALLPLSNFLVLPLFALVNAGVEIKDSLTASLSHPVGLGIVLGLFVGKQVGIFGATWLAVKLRLADLPDRVTWRQVHAMAIIAGIGFTMSLFVDSLAFAGSPLKEIAKLAILSGSLLSAVVGALLLFFATRRPEAAS